VDDEVKPVKGSIKEAKNPGIMAWKKIDIS
jgi:hypothetical protein